MACFLRGLLLFTALSLASPVPPPPAPQHVLDIPHTRSKAGNPRKLHGKFLHITDIHPDPFYRHGSNPYGDHPCHRGEGTAGYFGAEKTGCDTPFSLVNATFDWIKNNLKDELDFVIWTGDSARHDNDEKYPRTSKQVEHLNLYIVNKFVEVFGKSDNKDDPDPTNDFVVPIVPTYGNNDVLPHNIFEPGPNKWTRKYLTIWDKFVPQEQRHSFARGGWFFTEVIPNRLAVFSLNTLYFFDSNAAVDGCDDSSEPGYEHFEWLRTQLQFMRQRGMKAILMGHVPPARSGGKQNWDETCYQKYNLWLRQYRDVVVGSFFGHMNIDHFMLQDVRELTYKFKIKGIDDEGLRDTSSIGDGLHAEAKSDYLSGLRELWGNLPTPPHGISYREADVGIEKSKGNKKKKKQIEKFIKEIGGPYGERFSLSVISPSVVPNYFPSLRIIEYNISGLKHDHPALRPTAPAESNLTTIELWETSDGQSLDSEVIRKDSDLQDGYDSLKKKKKKKKKGKKTKPNFPIPEPPSKSSPPGPGYSPQALSLVSWTQLYANLTSINEAVTKEIRPQNPSLGQSDIDSDLQDRAFMKHFTYETEYSTNDDGVCSMKDLTMGSWLDYAEKIGRSEFNPELSGLDRGFDGEELIDAELGSDLVVPNAEISEDSYELVKDENFRTDEVCLAYLQRLREQAPQVYSPSNNDSWSSDFLLKLRKDMASSGCLPVEELDLRQEIEYGNEVDDENRDSGYDDDDNNDSTDDVGDSNDEKITKKKHKKKKKKKKKHGKKKGKKRKHMSLTKNQLWYIFVRRAFVSTKSLEELKDEFG